MVINILCFWFLYFISYAQSFSSAIFKQLLLVVIPLTIISIFFNKLIIRLK